MRVVSIRSASCVFCILAHFRALDGGIPDLDLRRDPERILGAILLACALLFRLRSSPANRGYAHLCLLSFTVITAEGA